MRYGHLVKITPERLAALEEQFRKRGLYLVMGARFVVVLRQLNGLIAGSAGMPFHRFLAANVVGALAWTAVWGAGPYLAADVFVPFWHWLRG
ncbi:VTT domain-containing protein [Bordetella holmesii]|nr:VTT domain-containing protein [Bordetella holmesii]